MAITRMRPDSQTPAKREWRPEIQALRALAVSFVLAYHLWPDVIPGGFVGVDVFFVISGFLIAGHLLKEISETGRVKVVHFWARRIRRLMPAALTVLFASLAATALLTPVTLRQQALTEIAAAAVYVENWLLASNAVDYLAAENSASIVQHYWSLSIEEQFYVALPLLLVGVLLVTRRASESLRVSFIVATLFALTAASFVFSVIAASNSPSAAYFVTTGRIWEFGLGALAAAASTKVSIGSSNVRAALSWLGLGGLTASLIVITPATPFPGVAALLPVLATLAVIFGRTSDVRWSATHAFDIPVVRWLAKVSYPAYLWHWPLIVIAHQTMGESLSLGMSLLLLVLTLLLSWATTTGIERPVQKWTRLRLPWVTFVSAAVVTAIILLGCVAINTVQASASERAANRIENAVSGGEVPCIGALAIVNECDSPYATNQFTAPELAVSDFSPVTTYKGCQTGAEDVEIIVCTTGEKTSPTVHIALIGDSHAGTLMDPLDLYGQANGWKITAFTKGWCAGTGALGVAAVGNQKQTAVESCATWGNSVIDTIIADPTIDAVIMTGYLRGYTEPSSAGRTITAQDFEVAWSRLLDAGKTVIAIRDTPLSGTATCVSEEMPGNDPCPVSREEGVGSDNNVVRDAAIALDVPYVDLTDIYCSENSCHAVIGGLVVMYDTHHITSAFAKTLATPLGDRLSESIESGR